MNLPLRDIKPNVTIIDYQWWGFIFLVFILALMIIYLIYKFFKKQKDENLQILKNLDFNDSKKVAYTFSKLARNYINEKNKDLFEEIEKELIQYKYKPSVPKINKNTKEKIKKFLRTI